MLFAHDTTAALTVATDLVNTERDDGEQLPDVAALEAFLDQRQVTRGPVGPDDLAAGHHRRARCSGGARGRPERQPTLGRRLRLLRRHRVG